MAESTIEPRESGVTVVQGPNEAGKSSTLEGLSLLIEMKDSSKSRRVTDTKPRHRDASPEVEIDAEVGPYRFTYGKRWLKGSKTELTITAPMSEQLTGDQAHERVGEILAEHMDMELWKALRVAQGDGLEPVDLKDQQALSRALDLAAGTAPIGDDEVALIDALKQEYDRYWTSTGREKQELRDAHEHLDELVTEVASAQEAVASVEHDLESASRLADELAQLEQSHPTLVTDEAKLRVDLDKAREAESQLKTAKAEHETAVAHVARLAELAKRHQKLEGDISEAESALLKLQEKAAGAPDLKELGSLVESAAKSHEAAKAARKQADALERLRAEDEKDSHFRLDLVQLIERKDAIDQARSAAKEARKVVATSGATSERIKQLHAVDKQRQSAIARLEAGAPRITLTSHQELDALVDSETVHLVPNEDVPVLVEGEKRIHVPNVLDVLVSPGADLEALRASAAEADEAWKTILGQIGAQDLETALEAHQRLATAQRQLDEVRKVEEEKLRDLTFDDMQARIRELEALVSAYAETRPADPAPPTDFDEARRLQAEALQAADVAREQQERAELELEAARARLETAKTARNEIDLEVTTKRVELRELRRNLQELVQEMPAEEMERQAQEANQALATKAKLLEVAEAAVDTHNPETAKALHDNASLALKNHDSQQATCKQNAAVLQDRIDRLSEAGLFDRLQQAESALTHQTRMVEGLRRRAGAAKLAFEILHEERSKARQNYIRPLQKRINQLGRIVYADDFNVALDDDLQIVERTNQGITVPFDSLSAGAKEQLGIILRIACAVIVSDDGPVPLVLDDTLGNSDPNRLKSMGALIAQAGKKTQVIVFTCMPDRFRNIGGAKIVRLEESTGSVVTPEASVA